MNGNTRIIGLVVLLAGVAWILQTVGLESSGLLAMSPRFFFVGAIIAGAGTGALAWTRMAGPAKARRRW